MGSRVADGAAARGRYIYISKFCGDFFPHLSTTVTNDNVLIPIVPPFNDTKIYSTYVYHNDKYNTPYGTRDEYRIYLNKVLDPNGDYFHVDDIVVFERIPIQGEPIPLYIMTRYAEDDAHYQELDAMVEASQLRGAHALVDEEINFIPHREIDATTQPVIPEEVMDEAVRQQAEVLTGEEQGTEVSRGASLFGPGSFRDFVLLAYGFRCAITENVIQYRSFNNLDAAHIQPRAQDGTYLPCNGIALCKDMHWAFDKGFITLNDDYTVQVHEEMRSSSLGNLQGKRIIVPAEPYFQPEQRYLRYHRDNIFGLFLSAGSIRSNQEN